MNKNSLRNFINFLKYLKPYWRKEIIVLFLNFTTAILPLAGPYLAKLVIDEAYAKKDFYIFTKLLVLAGLVFIISSLCTSLEHYLKNYINIKVRFSLERAIFQKLENLPYSFFQKRPIGEYIYKLNAESQNVASFITSIIPELCYTIPKFLFILAIILIMHWKITIFLFVAVPFLYLPTFLLIRRIRKKSEELIISTQNMFEVVRENFSNIQLVKAFAKEKTELRRFTKHLINNLRLNITSVKLDTLNSILDSWINRLIIGIITIYGGYNIIKGQITLGSFAAIMLYLNQLIALQGGLVALFIRVTLGNISLQRLVDILESWPQESDNINSKEFLFLLGEMEFKDVSFGYYPNKKVIQELSFKINGGFAVGLVGHSGCGKTTIVSLILKLYQLSEGNIFIDGQDINLIKNNSLRERIGVVLQKPILWNDTIRNNIRYAYPKATDKEILRSAEISCAYDFIKDLPEKFETVIGNEGIRLSEGQKQRIALARAIIKTPKILIIDEGMSSVDSQTEDSIIDNLRREFKNTTLIVISHRLSTVKKMDLVYFLENADKISIGYHEELVKQNLNYRELFASQIEEERIDIKL
ncbi:MAG: ABC transporter ATP-binding protein [Candidatus Omnitrophota bacterium]|nr:ABC transporter ATP-binding protein [Candidatus Omnitrophota bacterium]